MSPLRRLTLAFAAAAVVSGCASLPSNEGRSESTALRDTQGTRLGKASAALAAAHPGQSGIDPLVAATDAFAARVLLANAAERSIDTQYYIWRGDETGTMLFEALWDAARRGVRVRLLLDDQNTKGLDETLATLAANPNFQVRIYNPFAQRRPRITNYFGDFDRLNRRMHNKSFIVDNRAAIVGGRNVGNEYFGAGSAAPFVDLDVVAIGAAVDDLSAQFDRYWASASAYPIASLVAAPSQDAAARLEARFAQSRANPESTRYLAAVRDTPLVRDLLDGRLSFDWATARMVTDDPAKTLGSGAREGLALAEMMEVVGTPRASFDLISPYFVPGDKGTAVLVRLAKSGVRIRVLTNSLATNEAAVVHSGYAKRRCELARAGVRLYEMKPEAGKRAKKHDDDEPGGSGSSNSHLHAKTFAVDGEHVFVGSFNFDPRSALLNTELGLVIDSAPLAKRMTAAFDGFVARDAYEVRLREDGSSCVEWIDHTDAGEVVFETEPGASWAKRAWLEFLMALPVDWML